MLHPIQSAAVEYICFAELTRLSNNLFFPVGLGVNKSYNVNREGRGGACAAAENGPQVHSSRNLQEMSDFGEVVDLVCL